MRHTAHTWAGAADGGELGQQGSRGTGAPGLCAHTCAYLTACTCPAAAASAVAFTAATITAACDTCASAPLVVPTSRRPELSRIPAAHAYRRAAARSCSQVVASRSAGKCHKLLRNNVILEPTKQARRCSRALQLRPTVCFLVSYALFLHLVIGYMLLWSDTSARWARV